MFKIVILIQFLSNLMSQEFPKIKLEISSLKPFHLSYQPTGVLNPCNFLEKEDLQ